MEGRELSLGRGRRILVVEDDATALHVLAEILGNYGYVVFSANNGHDAIKAAKMHEFDGVLLDLGLPDMPGIEVLEGLRQLHPTIAILIVSGRKEYEMNVLANGANAFLLKPFEAKTLLNAMAQWFGKP